MRSVLYRNGRPVAENLPIEQLGPRVADGGETLWIDLEQSERAAFDQLAAAYQLHPLAIEDALEAPGRSRLDRFENHFFLTVYGTKLDDRSHRLIAQPMMAMLTRHTMITIRTTGSFDLAPVREQWEANPELLSVGAITMFWALVDSAVDSHFQTVQELDERTSELEADVFGDEPNIRKLQHQCFILHREVTHLRRLAMPLRDVSNSALRHDPQGAVGPITPYLQDVYDHALRVADWADNIHDTLSTMFDSILNAQSNQLNIVMKKITGWAAIIAVPTLITGYFGMNVSYPMFGTVAGFWFSGALMLASVGALYWAFKRSDWI